MIVCGCFPGDDDKALMGVQHDAYRWVVSGLLVAAQKRYEASVRLVGAVPDIYLMAKGIREFDHRVLQGSHDRIAAHFRWLTRGANQGELFTESPPAYRARVEREWIEYWEAEVRRLAEDDEVAQAILTAVAYENKPLGVEAEDHLESRLDAMYGSHMRSDHPAID